LRALAEAAALEIVEIRGLGGAIATVGQLIAWHMGWVRRLPVLGSLMGDSANAAIAWTVLKMDKVSRIYGGGAMKDTLNWLLVARRPELR
jgi:hypothetical protein